MGDHPIRRITTRGPASSASSAAIAFGERRKAGERPGVQSSIPIEHS
jgi:hypothetical protein